MTELNLNVNKSHKQYNYCLDFMKGIACLFVVWMHCEFPGKTGVIVQAISRFCVPFFFMVSGYFSGDMSKTARGGLIKNKKVKHIFKITLWASLFYLAWAIIRNLIWHDKSLNISISQAAVWLVFNQPYVISGHLWFLFALLYDYILVSVFDGKKIHNKQYLFGAISMALLFVLGQGVHLLGVQIPIPEAVRGSFGREIPQFVRIPNFIYRNWLIEGFAFFMLGRWIKENKDSVNISNVALYIIIVVSTVLCLVERQIMGRDFGVNICTLPQVLALFLYAVKNPERHAGFVQQVGRDCSLLVYVLHFFVWDIVAIFYSALGVGDNIVAKYLLPIIVVILSVLVALVFNWIVMKIKKESQKITS